MKKKKEVYVVLKDTLDVNEKGIIYVKKTELLEVFYFWSDAEKYIEELEKNMKIVILDIFFIAILKFYK